MKIKNNNQGFTLMEMLVVLAIFSVFVVIAADLFLTVNRVQRETRVSEQLLSETRFILDTIAREVRSGSIDYKAYGDPADSTDPVVNPVSELRYTSSGMEGTIIKTDSTVCPSAESTPCVAISRDNGVSWASMTPVGVKVINLRFIIQPEADPFYFDGVTWLADEQPMITAYITLGSTGELGSKYFEVTNQTSVSMRAYGR